MHNIAVHSESYYEAKTLYQFASASLSRSISASYSGFIAGGSASASSSNSSTNIDENLVKCRELVKHFMSKITLDRMKQIQVAYPFDMEGFGSAQV